MIEVSGWAVLAFIIAVVVVVYILSKEIRDMEDRANERIHEVKDDIRKYNDDMVLYLATLVEAWLKEKEEFVKILDEAKGVKKTKDKRETEIRCKDCKFIECTEYEDGTRDFFCIIDGVGNPHHVYRNSYCSRAERLAEKEDMMEQVMKLLVERAKIIKTARRE